MFTLMDAVPIIIIVLIPEFVCCEQKSLKGYHHKVLPLSLCPKLIQNF